MAPPEYPFHRISFDWFSFEASFNGLTGCVILKCDLTSFTKVYPAEGKHCIGRAVKDFKDYVARQYGVEVYQAQSDNDPSLRNDFTD